jgi:hypothetical protein
VLKFPDGNEQRRTCQGNFWQVCNELQLAELVSKLATSLPRQSVSLSDQAECSSSCLDKTLRVHAGGREM